ncbi:phosphoribosylformylglycinamidine synthase subunit PurS [Nitratifractor salsuginis]|uniref:Phosphoribosylformylglycinamidine synthase subunit PurS n=1 Tax=Nitratifractor salsuginis (strain DSM 16511 / JCM 12458 / E9I37-1) TaxID=749222 RepID=E6X036_NITSE|nr:phosphoribosylformylglycinamidine synthase subunit PurS [Nitratifractor salsuginis]ADV46759.1 phosphoribosylformylglycinamidine synthase, purS [Nitratifractor salsuginis DSM 16511]
MKAIINVYLKEGVLDPQGKAVHHALGSLGFNNVKEVRIGKQIVLELDETDREKAMKELKEMAETLLANTVIEDYDIEIAE